MFPFFFPFKLERFLRFKFIFIIQLNVFIHLYIFIYIYSKEKKPEMKIKITPKKEIQQNIIKKQIDFRFIRKFY